MDKPVTSQSVSGVSVSLGTSTLSDGSVSNTMAVSQTQLQSLSDAGPIIIVGDTVDVEVSV